MIAPFGSPPSDSSNAEIPLFTFKLSRSMLNLTRLLLLSEALLVDRLPLPLNPLFHYPSSLGYWVAHDLFVA